MEIPAVSHSTVQAVCIIFKMARVLAILFVVLLWCVLSLSINYEMTYVDPQGCTDKNKYFQYSSLSCEDCGSGQKPSQDFISCTCKSGYKIVLNNGGPSKDIKCFNCGGSLNETSSLDGSFCIRCQNNSTGGFIGNTGTCICPENSFARDRGANGVRLSTRQCVTCTEDTKLSGAEEKTCRRYHSSFLLDNNDNNATVRQECVNGEKNSGYTVVGGICFQDSDLIEEKNNLYKVTYVDEDNPIESSYYERNLRAAEALCKKYSNFTACQLFGNLCVLHDYTGEVCDRYETLVDTPVGNPVNGNSDWPAYMPWLFYNKKNAGEAPDILDKKEITKTFERNEDIKFLLVVYTLNGFFVGYENGLDSIQICKERPSKMASASKFATTYKSSCSVPVNDLKNMSMFLYDMFIVLGDKIYPVPVLMENYVSGNEKVNENSDRTKWQLTRRFFVVDNKIGIRPESKELEFIRYSSKIEVNIRLRSSDGEIYPPMLRIRYEPLEVKDKAKSSIEMSFAVTYEMDLTKIKKDTEVSY